MTEFPSGSNRVKYNTDFYGYDVSGAAYPWCCAFVWWVFHECDADALFYGGYKTAGCTTLMRYHKSRGELVYGDYRAGDIVFFDFDNDRTEAEHVGIVRRILSSTEFETIEGNTSVSSNDNGGAVMVRVRSTDDIICAYRPPYDKEENMDIQIKDITDISSTGDAHSPWAEKAISTLIDAGIFNGDGKGNYGWKKPITREATAVVLYNILEKLGLLEEL